MNNSAQSFRKQSFSRQRGIPALILVAAFISGCSGSVKKPAACPGDLLFFKGECVKKEKIEMEVRSDFIEIDKLPADRALTAKEIEKVIGPVFKKYMLSKQSWKVPYLFDDEVRKRGRKRDERGLRLLLNVKYYHDNYSPITCAEISEGWRDAVIFYIEEKPDLVIKVASDKKQLHRKVIEDAFHQFADQFSVDMATGEINDKRFTSSNKAVMQAIKREKLGQ